jgi:uracil DNA glycosylase
MAAGVDKMEQIATTKDIGEDELALRILNALRASELTHDQVTVLGQDPHRTAIVLESLQAMGLVEAYCGAIRPSMCMYRLAGKRTGEQEE